jgi:hypothetical protein
MIACRCIVYNPVTPLQHITSKRKHRTTYEITKTTVLARRIAARRKLIKTHTTLIDTIKP